MSLIWGATWIATKAGIAAVPPFFFGAARYVLVSAVLVFVVRDLRAVFHGRALRLIATGMLVVVATWRHALALVLGIGGLVLLFSGKATMTGNTMELWGAAALVAGSLAYCLGSVLSRPLLDQITPLQLTAAQGLVGAIGLSVLSLIAEPVSGATFAALFTPKPLAGVLFLVICGTFIAYIIFLRLMRDWGAARAGLYSFVSPVVALILGAIVYGEPLTWREITGAAIMLLAAWIAIARKPITETPPA